MIDHSYEELRAMSLDLLAGRETGLEAQAQYGSLIRAVGEAFLSREGQDQAPRNKIIGGSNAPLTQADRNLMLEVFWGLFREGVITLGINDSNREFPFFRLSGYGKQIIEDKNVYFFHDVASFEKLMRQEVPEIDDITVIYLKEAMQSFRVGCLLSSSVMLGVAAEHTFKLLIETVSASSEKSAYASVEKEKGLLRQVNKFKNIIDQKQKSLPADIKEDFDTRFAGILSIIRTFRNDAGHPTGKIIDREQAYINLQLFIPFAKKLYQLRKHFNELPSSK